MKKTLLLVLLCAFCSFVNAQEDTLHANRYVMHCTMYGVGMTNILDTYLSPVEYTGPEIRLLREKMRMTKLMGGNVSVQNMLQANISLAKNKADTGSEMSSMVNWTYGYHYQFRITDNLKILTGPMLEVNGGFVYNTRNSNNPAQAKAYVNLAASGMIIYKFNIGNYPLIARYQANMPFLGLMFSPDYGQSYYEIFSLNHWNSNNLVVTSLHNQPSIRQLLTIDFPINKVNMRVGYVCDIQQAKVNNLKSHMWSHSFMIGFVKNFYMIKGKNRVSMPQDVTPY